MSSAARMAVRAAGPVLLAAAGLAAFSLPDGGGLPGRSLATASLLVAPGWGLLRCLSVIDRRFAVIGASLLLSTLLAAALGLRGAATPEQLGLLAHLVALLASLAGALRMALHARAQRSWTAHPAPMPLWPQHAGWALLLLALLLALSSQASAPLAPPAGGEQLAVAATAEALLSDAGRFAQAGASHPVAALPAAVATLVAGGGLATPLASWLIVAATLLVTLLFAAEAISRLRGNRGALLAMAAVLAGCNPLAALYRLAAGRDDGRGWAQWTPGIPEELLTALRPWLDSESFALTGACVAMLLSTTLSVVRRASFHVPRLAGVAAAGVALSDPDAAALLLPGWLLGLLLAHVACSGSPDNDPSHDNSQRRAHEPVRLRAPFVALAVPIGAGCLAGWLLAGWPELSGGQTRRTGTALVTAVFPACLLFVPGVRQLHRSPGREAWFFVGLFAGLGVLALQLHPPGDNGVLATRLAALLAAVPVANGALTLIERRGRRARVALAALLVAALIAPAALIVERVQAPAPLVWSHATANGDPPAAPVSAGLQQALLEVRARAPDSALLHVQAGAGPEVAVPADFGLPAAALLSGRRMLAAPPPGRPRASGTPAGLSELLERLPEGHRAPLLALRGHPRLGDHELWSIARERLAPADWPGFERVADMGPYALRRAPAPAIVLLTLSGLAPGETGEARLPERFARLASAFEHATRVPRAFAPTPELLPDLHSLFTGLRPDEHGVLAAGDRYDGALLTLPAAFAARGRRTLAVHALAEDGGLSAHFEARRGLPAPDLAASTHPVAARVDALLAGLAEADRRPPFAWLQLEAAAPDNPRAAEEDARLEAELLRLLASLAPTDLVALVGLPARSDSSRDTPDASGFRLAHLRVTLLLRGGGFAAESFGGLFALHDLPALLLSGRWPSRTRSFVMQAGRDGHPTGWGLLDTDGLTLLLPPDGDGAPARGRFEAWTPGKTQPASPTHLAELALRRGQALDERLRR